jgi:hypothetical protein
MILIDDVTVTHAFPSKKPLRLWPLRKGQKVITAKKRSADGIHREWEIVGGRGFVIRYCPELGHVEARLSIPRLAYSSSSAITYNFPLAATMPDLAPVSEGLVRALRLAPALKGRTPGEALRLMQWPVRRIAYTLDVRVTDVAGTISAVQGLRRTGNPVQSWGSPPHACQWAADSYRFMVYSKEHEIRARRGQVAPPLRQVHDEFDRVSSEFRQGLIEKAHGVVRLETTLWPKTLREPWKAPGGMLPTLDALQRPDVIAYFMGGQLHRLRLDVVPEDVTEDEAPQDKRSKANDPAALAFMFDAALTSFEANGEVLSGSGGAMISCSRVAQLLVVYQYSGVLDDATLCRVLRMAAQTLAARRRNLRELGLPIVGSCEPHAQRCLRELVTGIRAAVPSWPQSPPEVAGDDWCEAPWIDMLPDRDTGDDEVAVDDVADGFDEVLEGVTGEVLNPDDLDIDALLADLDDMGQDEGDDLCELLATGS